MRGRKLPFFIRTAAFYGLMKLFDDPSGAVIINDLQHLIRRRNRFGRRKYPPKRGFFFWRVSLEYFNDVERGWRIFFGSKNTLKLALLFIFHDAVALSPPLKRIFIFYIRFMNKGTGRQNAQRKTRAIRRNRKRRMQSKPLCMGCRTA